MTDRGKGLFCLVAISLLFQAAPVPEQRSAVQLQARRDAEVALAEKVREPVRFDGWAEDKTGSWVRFPTRVRQSVSLNSKEDLSPPKYEWGALVAAPVALSKRTRFA